MKIALAIAALLAFTFPNTAPAQDLPDGPGKNIVVKACTACHGSEQFSSKQNTKDDWKAVVDTMIGYGAEIGKEDSGVIVEYLTKHFGKESKIASVRGARAKR